MQMRAIDLEQLDIDRLIDRGSEFHGHLGPFLVVGIRMGILALRELGSKGHMDMQATVETGVTPPVSCLVDGIQIATGCTLGKGNIKLLDKGKATAIFTSGDRRVRIELRPEIMEMILAGDPEALAGQVREMPEEILFLWNRL